MSIHIAVIGLDDPADRRSWSGTPANVISALKLVGVSTTSVHVNRGAFVKGLGALLCWVNGHTGSDWRRPSLVRWIHSQAARNGVRRSGATVELHMGSLTLGRRTSEALRFCFLDCTLEQWTRDYDSGAVYRRWRFMSRLDRAEKRGFGSVDQFFVASTATKQSLVDHYRVPSTRVTVTGTGLGFAEKFPVRTLDYNSQKLLFVAKQRFEDKGASLLMSAFKLAKQELPGLELAVIGGGPVFSDVPPNLGISVRSNVTLQELCREFEQASLFVMPARREPWGLVYLEAMAFGLPIMGLRRNAFPELAGEGEFGYVVDGYTAEDLSQAICSAVRDPAGLASRGRAAAASIPARFSWENVATEILTVARASL